MPLEVGRRSAELRAAALGHDDDVGAARTAVFGLVVRRLNLHFRDRIERGGHVVGRAEPGVLAGDAVVRHPHQLVAESVDLRPEERIPARRVAHVGVDHARHALQQPEEVAAAQLRVLDLVGPDRARAFAALRLGVQRRGLDGHDLLEATDIEGDRGHREPLRRTQHEALLFVGPEPGQRDAQVIRTGKQIREHEQPFAVRHDIAGHRGRGIAHRHRRTRNRPFAVVDHRAADLTAQSLGVREPRRPYRQGQGQESEDTSETFHLSSSA